MKIAFITASLDPGRDGVGDYTRRLAQACRDLGHDACLISLNENEDALPSPPAGIPEIRLPSTQPWIFKIGAAREFLNAQRPDCISLQFVCYGYSPNGICRNIDHWLDALTAGFDVQVMLHELWIGWWPNATLRERVVGAAQKFCVTRMLRRLHPKQIQTSIPVYVELLKSAGFTAKQLALFGNIPLAPDDAGTWLSSCLHQAGISIDAYHRDEYFIGGIFGSIHANWPAEPLLAEFAKQVQTLRRKPLLVSIGRMGPGKDLWERLARVYDGRIRFVKLGECTPQQISLALQSLDFGIATTPYVVIGKSGSLAAMLEHGCPVIVNWHEETFTGQQPETQLHLLKPDFDFSALRRRAPRAGVMQVAECFLRSLNLETVMESV